MRLQRVRLTQIFVMMLAFFLGRLPARAQITGVTPDQVPPVPGSGYDYIHSAAETVDPQTGSLTFHLQLPMPPGLDLTAPFAFSYNSGAALHHVILDTGAGWTDNSVYLGRGGWSYDVPTLAEFGGTFFVNLEAGGNTPCHFFNRYTFTDINGTSRNLALQIMDTQQACQPAPLSREFTVSGDGIVGATTTSIGFNQSTPSPVTVADLHGNFFQFSNAPARLHSYPGDNQSNVNNHLFSDNDFMSLPDWIETRNGNRVIFNDQRNGAFSVTDTAGRIALQSNGFGGTGNGGSNTVTISGFEPYVVVWSPPQAHNWAFNSQVTPADSISTDCGSPGTSASGSQPEVSQITLPNGRAYQFEYDPVTGLISQITYPSGAVVSYQWTQNPLSISEAYRVQPPGVLPSTCNLLHDTPAVLSRIVKFDGVTAALEQDFSYTTTWSSSVSQFGDRVWISKQTIVLTKDLVNGTTFKTIHTYTNPSDMPGPDPGSSLGHGTGFALASVSAIYGEDGRLLRTDTSNWSQAVPPQSGFSPLQEITTLDTGQTSQVITCYDGTSVSGFSCGPATFPSIFKQGSQSVAASVISDRYAYDYGPASSPGTPGSLVRHSHTDYHQFAANPLGIMVADRPDDTIIYDGAGTKASETDYFYDETTTGAATAVAHDETDFPAGTSLPRGNLTTKIVKCLLLASGGLCPDSKATYHYDETGQVTSATDPNGNTTTFSYLDSFFDPFPPINAPLPSGNTNAYLTKITYAQTGTVSHIESFSYAYSDGQLTKTIGQNGNLTTYIYKDPLRRLTETDFPDGGTKLITYNDAGPNPSVVTQTAISPTQNMLSTTVFDGLGHAIQTQLNSDPEGVDYVDIAYDGLGRVFQKSNPHRPTVSATDGTTTYQYDALGRVTQVAPPDGTIPTAGSTCLANNVCTSYSGSVVTMIDQAGKPRRTITDGLGRLIEVDEPGSPTFGTAAFGPLPINGVLRGSVTVSISGADRHINAPDSPFPCPPSGCPQIYDSGSACININAVPYCAGYDQGINDTAAAMAAALSGAINSGSGNAYVAAAPSGANVIVTSRSGVSLGSVSISFSAGSDDTADFPTGSYRGTVAAPVYDSGTVSASVNGFTGAPVSYSSTENTSADQVAAALVATLNVAGSPVTAQVSGAELTLTYKTVGTQGNAPVSISSLSSNPTVFPGGSFGGSATLAHGADPDPTGMSAPFPTLYTYDALGNLTIVNQIGDRSQPARVRNFTYDSLSRLLTAQNPETGAITYGYDKNGNVLTRTAPAPNQPVGSTATVATNYRYDQLNRLLYESFSDGTYRGGFTYDESGTTQFGNAVVNGIGRLTSSWEAWGGQGFSYDKMGRPTTARRVVEHAADFLYAYNLDGSVKSLQYPSGRVLNYTYDAAGHAISAIDGSGQQYIWNATYWPNGATFQQWTPRIYLRTDLNNRLQLSHVYSDNGQVVSYYLDKTYNYGPQNNGNVLSIVNNKDSNRTESFSYDALNRIASGSTSGSAGPLAWGENYSIDPWGNLQISQMAGKPNGGYLPCAADANNRSTCLTYDAAGNATGNGSAWFTYDAGNMLKTVGPITYWYDNDGQRYIKWNNGVPVKSYFYGPNGEILAEGSGGSVLTAEYIYFNGKRVARVDMPSNVVHYYLSDHLNSTSMVVGATGAVEEESDYSPFGTEYVVTGPGANQYKFGGKERDSETGLDYFGARYYSNGLGRFISPDYSATPVPVPYADFTDPQSMNLYSYVRNLPTTKIDRDGHGILNAIKCSFGSVDACKAQADEKARKAQAARDALHRKAEDARKTLSGMKGFTMNGMTPKDFANSANDQQALAGLNAATNFIFAEAQKNFFCAPGVSCGIVVPLGLGSTGRTVAASLEEQLAMEEVMSNPKGVDTGVKMNDSRWPSSQGWVKMTQTVNGIEIHWVENTITGAVDDFKFK